LSEKDWLQCSGSAKFAREMAISGPFSSYQEALDAARDIWFNKIDVSGWLEAFAAHPPIGSSSLPSPSSARWSKGEQSIALATATDHTLQELYDWNARYEQKFGFIFLIFASGRSSPEILAELKKRYPNRPLVEFENAAKEEMKIMELRLSKLLSANSTSDTLQPATNVVAKAGEDRVSILGAHLTATADALACQIPSRTRPPITTHVLDVARGSPAAGIEVSLETLDSFNQSPRLDFHLINSGSWKLHGSSITNKDGRSGQLMNTVDVLNPGFYRISFNTGKYNPDGFFPYVSIVFEVRESQKLEHFHVPLLLSPFSFSTYRGS
ncbi:5-hydroxyisourate hydrolase, partial [Genlisea aurea]